MGPLLVANGAISAISGVITLLLAGNRPTFIIGMIDYKESSTNLSEWIPKWLLFSLPVSLMPATTPALKGIKFHPSMAYTRKKHRPRSPCRGILGSNWKSNSVCYDCLPLLVARRTKKNMSFLASSKLPNCTWHLKQFLNTFGCLCSILIYWFALGTTSQRIYVPQTHTHLVLKKTNLKQIER